ncbi:L-rhamnose isomerase [Escherichia coli]
MPWQAVWEMYRQRHDTPTGSEWLESVLADEKSDFEPAWVNTAGCGTSALSGLRVECPRGLSPQPPGPLPKGRGRKT